MSFDKYKLDYDRDGFVVVRNFLANGDLAALSQNLDRYIQDVVPELPDSAAFYDEVGRPESLKQLQHMGRDEFFDGYRRNLRWSALAATLVGESVKAQEPEWFNKPPGTIHPTPPHQDNFYFCLRPPNVVTLWLALDPVDEENGCLRYVSGSHKHGIRDHQLSDVLGFSQTVVDYNDEDTSREHMICLEPGDLVAHHGETIHRADPNRSPARHRRAFAMVFRGENCQRDKVAFDRYQSALQNQHESFGLSHDPG